MRDEGIEVGRIDSSSIERALSGLGHLAHGPPEDLLPLHRDDREDRSAVVAVVDEGLRHVDGVLLPAIGTPDGRADRRNVRWADDDCSSAIGEEERRAAIVGVDPVGELLDADHDDVC